MTKKMSLIMFFLVSLCGVLGSHGLVSANPISESSEWLARERLQASLHEILGLPNKASVENEVEIPERLKVRLVAKYMGQEREGWQYDAQTEMLFSFAQSGKSTIISSAK